MSKDLTDTEKEAIISSAVNKKSWKYKKFGEIFKNTPEKYKKLGEILTQSLIPMYVKMPKEDKCPKCGKGKLIRMRLAMSRTMGGMIICQKKDCDYRESVVSYLGKKIISVEPLPPNDPQYLAFMKKPDETKN